MGPDYLFGDHGLNEHGMVQYDESSIYVIGGYEGCTDSPTDETWIINPLNNFKKKIGPMLKTMRSKHCCGKMYTKDGSKILLVVAGGVDISYPHLIKSVEILDPTSDQGWIEGPKLPFALSEATMVTSPDGCGVIIIGGNKSFSDDEYYDDDWDDLPDTR